MSQIEISSANATEKGERATTRLSRLNEVTFWVMLGVVALAPIPFGSARGFFWGLLAFIIGTWALIYTIGVVAIRQGLRIGFERFGLQMLLMGIFCLWLVVQILPLDLVPLQLRDGVSVPLSTISVAPDATALMLVRQLTYGLFFILVLQACANETRRSLMFDVLLVITVAYGVFGLVSLQSGDTILGLEKWAYQGYATSTFVNRNSFATFLAMGGALAAARIGKLIADASLHHVNDGRPRNVRSNLIMYGLAYLFLVTVVLSTGSRMGLFVTIIGGAISATIAVRRSKRLAHLALAIPTALAIVVLAFVFYGSRVVERLGGLESSADVRSDLYWQILEMVRERPFWGYGGGTFELAFPIVHQAPVSSDVVWSMAHNSYLALWVEAGLIFGSLPIIAIGAIAIKIITAVIRRRGNLETQAIALGVIAIGAIHSLVDFSLEIPANTFVFLALLAAGTASTVNLKVTK